MKKIVLSLLTVFMVLSLSVVLVKANESATTVSLEEGVQIRTDGNNGLKWVANIENHVDTNEYGFLFAQGDLAEVTVGTEGVVKQVVEGVTKEEPTMCATMVNFPKKAATQDISVVAYVLADGVYTYSNVVVRNLAEVAVEAYEEKKLQDGFVASVYDTTKTSFNTNGGALIGDYSFKVTSYSADTSGKYIGIESKEDRSTAMGVWWNRIAVKYDETVDAYKVVGVQTGDGKSFAVSDYDYLIGAFNSGLDQTGIKVAKEIVALGDNALNLYVSFELPAEKGFCNLDINFFTDMELVNNFDHIGGGAELPKAYKDYYTFDGWYNNSELNGSAIKYQGNDRNLYAKFTPIEYTISYNLGDAKWNNDFTPITSYNYESDTIILPTAEDMTIENGTFIGWVNEEGKTITEISKGSNGNLNLEAVWDFITTTVTYNLDNGAFVTEYEFVLQNFNTYAGLADGSQNGIVPLEMSKTRMNKTWKRIVIEYDAKLGLWYTTGVGSTTANNDIVGSVNAYVIGSHNNNADAITKAKIEAIFNAVSEGKVYYFDLGTFTLDNVPSQSNTWNQKVIADTDYTLLKGNKVTYTESVLKLPKAYKEGYVFNGWYDNAEFTGNIVTSVTVDNEDVETNLYAKYTPVEYTITWVLNGGEATVTLPTAYTIESDTITLPTASQLTFANGEFAGWYDEEDNPVTEIEKGSKGNIVLTAKWNTSAVNSLEIEDVNATALNSIYTVNAKAPTIIVVPSVNSAGQYKLTNVNLNSSYNDVVYEYGVTLFSNVTAALSAADTNNIIYVFAGTYNESLTLNVSGLILAGANYNIAGNGVRNTESDFTGKIKIASSVEINGIKMSGGTSSDAESPISLTATIEGVKILNSYFAQNFLGNSGYATNRRTVINQVANVSVTTLIVSYNYFDCTVFAGATYLKKVLCINSGKDITFTYNTITGTVHGNNAVRLYNSTSGTFNYYGNTAGYNYASMGSANVVTTDPNA